MNSFYKNALVATSAFGPLLLVIALVNGNGRAAIVAAGITAIGVVAVLASLKTRRGQMGSPSNTEPRRHRALSQLKRPSQAAPTQ